MSQAEKKCSKCGSSGPFPKNSAAKDGLGNYCVECQKRSNARYRMTHPKQVSESGKRYYKRGGRSRRLQRDYGIDENEWQRIFESQGRRCAICRTDDPGARNWHTDHDHVTGIVRGILCAGCNGGIGYLKDDPKLCDAASVYLKKWR